MCLCATVYPGVLVLPRKQNKTITGRLELLYCSSESVKLQTAITYIQWQYTVLQMFKYIFIE